MPPSSTTTLPPLSAASAERLMSRSHPATLAPKLRVNSKTLFAGTDELEIEHGDALYRLRITSLGKLILTK